MAHSATRRRRWAAAARPWRQWRCVCVAPVPSRPRLPSFSKAMCPQSQLGPALSYRSTSVCARLQTTERSITFLT